MTQPKTGPYSGKPYKCNRCGNVSNIGTNHWGEVYSRCSNCSWKHPLEADSHECLEPVPDGFDIPEPWTVTTLGEIAEIIEGP